MPRDDRDDRAPALLAAAFATLGTAAIAWWFAAHAQPLLVGTTPQASLVPWWYQATAFPPYLLLLAGLALRRDASWLRRAGFLALMSAIALVRVKGLIPLSGHGVFLSGALLFAWLEPLPSRRALLATSALGLAVTTVYKVLWHDLVFFTASVVVGVVVALLFREERPAPR